MFGESEILPLKEVKAFTVNLLKNLQDAGPLFLVFHTKSEDIKYVI